MPKSWNRSHRFGRCCTSGEMICFGALSSDSALATMKAFSPVSGLNGTLTICVLSSSSMSMPPWCVKVIVGARKCVESVSEKYTSCSAGTAASKVTPFDLAYWWPWRCSTKYSRSFSFSAVFRSDARPIRPALPFLPTPPLNTGLMNTSPCRSIIALISLLAGVGPEDLGRRKADELQQLRAVQHSGDLHTYSLARERRRTYRRARCALSRNSLGNSRATLGSTSTATTMASSTADIGRSTNTVHLPFADRQRVAHLRLGQRPEDHADDHRRGREVVAPHQHAEHADRRTSGTGRTRSGACRTRRRSRRSGCRRRAAAAGSSAA